MSFRTSAKATLLVECRKLRNPGCVRSSGSEVIVVVVVVTSAVRLRPWGAREEQGIGPLRSERSAGRGRTT